MQTVGERLEEARKRKGISLREAAEATKIRSDFLDNIEQDKFDFDLPELYKRGFLKNYARYLKLDPETLATDYNAQMRSAARGAKREGSEWFGHMDPPDSGERRKNESTPAETDAETGGGDEAPTYGRLPMQSSPPSGSASPPEPEEDEEGDYRGERETDETGETMFYLKTGAIVGGTIALVFVIIALIRSILAPSAEEETAAAQNGEPTATENAGSGDAASEPEPEPETITVNASGEVYVIVRQQSDDEVLLRETLSAGDSVPIEKRGPVDILFTAGENLEIEHGGERLAPSSSGTAKITIE